MAGKLTMSLTRRLLGAAMAISLVPLSAEACTSFLIHDTNGAPSTAGRWNSASSSTPA